MKGKQLWHGGDYNPEQWLHMSEILELDIERFLEAKINLVTVGVFSWSKLEPSEGDYHFDWMENIIDHLYENGISVILATPSGARPHWMVDRYPEVLRVNELRQRELFGRRHNHCFTSPVYRLKTGEIDRRLAERFGRHPAVKMWHISNELGGECHCPLCQAAFRQWLKEKYRTIEELNDSWCTDFWSHTYDGFEQVESPSPLGETSIMGLNLDWKRFVSDQTIRFMEKEIEALRSGGAMQPVTTNMMYDFSGIDYGKMAQKLDFVSWDSYPLWNREPLKQTAEDTAFAHDMMRSLKHKPYIMMESSPGATNWQGVSKLKKPGLVQAASLQSIAHGANGALYFQMRQSRGGEEKFHAAVIDHYGGNDSRTFLEVCDTGRMLHSLAEIEASETKSKVAVVYDWENRWALEGSKGPRNEGLHHMGCIKKSHAALRKCALNVDVIDQNMPLSSYEIVVVPMQYLFRDGFAEKIENYVKEGGTLVMTYWSGVVNENDRCFLGETPHRLTKVLGLRREEIDGLYDWEKNELVPVLSEKQKRRYTCDYLCELVKPFAAKTCMVYGRDFYAGRPALLCNSYGKGIAYYLCADAEQAFYDDFYQELIRKSDISCLLPNRPPEGVEVTSRETENAEYLFLQNFSNKEKAVDYPKGNILYGKGGDCLLPLEGVVVKINK